MAGRSFALDTSRRMSRGGHSMASAQPGLGQEGAAQDGDQVADERVLRHAAAVDEQRLGLDGRTTNPDPVQTNCLWRVLYGLRGEHQRGNGS